MLHFYYRSLLELTVCSRKKLVQIFGGKRKAHKSFPLAIALILPLFSCSCWNWFPSEGRARPNLTLNFGTKQSQTSSPLQPLARYCHNLQMCCCSTGIRSLQSIDFFLFQRAGTDLLSGRKKGSSTETFRTINACGTGTPQVAPTEQISSISPLDDRCVMFKHSQDSTVSLINTESLSVCLSLDSICICCGILAHQVDSVFPSSVICVLTGKLYSSCNNHSEFNSCTPAEQPKTQWKYLWLG